MPEWFRLFFDETSGEAFLTAPDPETEPATTESSRLVAIGQRSVEGIEQ